MLDRWGQHIPGLLAGLLITFGVMALSREVVVDFLLSAGRDDAADHRWAALLLVVLGVAIAAVTILARQTGVLTVAIPALLLSLFYSPFLLRLRFPDWYPDNLARLVLESYNVHIPLIIGVFAGAAAWRLAQDRSLSGNETSPEPGRDSSVPTGV